LCDFFRAPPHVHTKLPSRVRQILFFRFEIHTKDFLVIIEF
jgi:hypothetical protein